MIRSALTGGAVPLWGAINRSHPLNAGRIGWWLTLPGRGWGPKVYDLTNQNHGSFAGITSSVTSGWQATPRPGGWGHIAFDGVDDQITLANTASLRLPASTNRFSIALWARPDAGNAVKFVNLVNVGVPEFNNKGYQLRISSDPHLFGQFGTNLANLTLLGAATITYGVWSHFGLTWNGNRSDHVCEWSTRCLGIVGNRGPAERRYDRGDVRQQDGR
jgi:hypothetical protein